MIIKLMKKLSIDTIVNHVVKCEDTDECALGNHNCDTLGPGYLCLNMQGTFR